MSEAGYPDRPLFHVVAVVMSEFTHHTPLDGAERMAARVAAHLTDRGGLAHPWDVEPELRDEAAVKHRLRAWEELPTPRSSVLMWFGHGASTGDEAWLATVDTPSAMEGEGWSPDQFAQWVRREWRIRQGQDPPGWAVVVIEACGAATFVTRLNRQLSTHDQPRRLALLGIGGHGTNYLGTFERALTAAIGSYNDNDDAIRLLDLLGRVGRRIDEALGTDQRRVLLLDFDDVRLPRRRLLPAAVTAPMDVYASLRELLAELPPDQRNHFVPKAQGAEHGELAWYFTGRSQERQRLAKWLREAESGMLTITGRAGSGKSALLGDALAQSNPGLRQLLATGGLVTPAPEHERPPDNAFDVVVHLTGLTAGDVVQRLAEAADLPAAAAAPAEQLNQLLEGLNDRRFTLLADALDEAQEPTSIAGSVLRRVAALPHGRVVVGTRASTTEGPDQPEPTDEDLLDALGRSPAWTTVAVERDPDTIEEYVRRRLTAARTAGVLALDDPTISEVAGLIRAHDRQFLYARLAVHEILADPRLLDGDRRADLVGLLRHDHRALFATAVDRLGQQAPATGPLLCALALAHGRGLPRADRLWSTVAEALAGELAITETDIDDVLVHAAPYVMLDAEHGQSVYRLSHRTFQEYLLTGSTSEARHRVTRALLATCRERPSALNAYLVHHLAGHVAETHSWWELADAPAILDQLDPNSVFTRVLPTSWAGLPAPVAATAAYHYLLADADPGDRGAIRAVAMARHTDATAGEIAATQAHVSGPWRLAWADATRRPTSAVLTTNRGVVMSLAAAPMPDGHTLLAAGHADGTIQLWNPATGLAVGDPINAHPRAVMALAMVPTPDGSILLASGGPDNIVRMWHPTTGQLAGEPLVGHDHWVSNLVTVPTSDGDVLLASGSHDGTIRLWCPSTGQPAGEPLTISDSSITAMATVRMRDGNSFVVSGSNDEVVRLWEPATSRLVHEWREVSMAAALAGVQMPGGHTLLAVGHNRGMSLLDPEARRHLKVRACRLLHSWSRRTWGRPDLGTRWELHRLTPVPRPGGGTLLAYATRGDDSVRVWDPASGLHSTEPLVGHTQSITALATVPMSDGRTLLASGSHDGTIRLWNEVNARQTDPSRRRRVEVLATVPAPGGQPLLAAGDFGDAIQLRDLATGNPVATLTRARTRAVSAIAAVTPPGGRALLAFYDWDGALRLHDSTSGRLVRRRRGRRTSIAPVALTALPMDDGRTLLASVDQESLQLWDAHTLHWVDELLARPDSSEFWRRAQDEPLRTLLAERVDKVAAMPAPGGYTLLTGSSFDMDGSIHEWDVVSRQRRSGIVTGRASIWALSAAQLPDGRAIVATGHPFDAAVRLWNREGQALQVIRLGAPVRALAVTGTWLAIGLGEEGMVVCELDPARLKPDQT